jgi:hypothetical protein
MGKRCSFAIAKCNLLGRIAAASDMLDQLGGGGLSNDYVLVVQKRTDESAREVADRGRFLENSFRQYPFGSVLASVA